ncbi:hypothetical protein [Paenibacillus sp. GYB003]|uniref:hypothetical protein n=1 Tax=Paenibacillus sp. GYB003 TaxID=2994392 RepID=UPI002F96B6FF
MKVRAIAVFAAALGLVMSSGCEEPPVGEGVAPALPATADGPKSASNGPGPGEERVQGERETAMLSENELEGENGEALHGFKLLVRMVDGVYREESDPGPFQGRQYEGRFAAELIDRNGTTVASLDLNDAFGESPLRFREPFPIPLLDYNGDGFPEFAIGQYASSNLYAYRLFTVKPNEIVRLNITGVPELMSSDRSYAAAFPRAAPGSFTVPVYDNSKGSHYEERFEWREGEFRLAGRSDRQPLEARPVRDAEGRLAVVPPL